MPERARILEIRLGNRRIGHLVNYRGSSAFFAAPDYVADPGRPVLSQSFRGSDEARTQRLLTDLHSELTNSRVRVPPFFANLLPEGALRARIAGELRVSEDAEFDILAALGRDLPGAVTATLAEEVPPAAFAFFGEGVADHISSHIGRTVEKFSLSGVQLKFSVLRNSQGRYVLAGESETGDIILKPSHPAFPHLPENEYSSMRLAQLAGVDTPEAWLVDPSEVEIPALRGLQGAIYAIRRFDRVGSVRVHIEDFAQVLGIRAANKYGETNYDTILRIITNRTRNGLLDARQLVRRLVVNVLIGNGDAHIKNFSLIYRDPQYPDLAPAYDIISTIQYLPQDQSMALNIAGQRQVADITIASFERLERKVGLLRPVQLAREARQTVQRALDTWPAELPGLPMEEDHKEVIRERLRTLPITNL
ncbi:MAG: type II toxin-antitoxin system HipA family toxin [Chloroflexota bacterium]